MVTITPTSETIPFEPNVVSLEINLDPVTSLSENLNLEVQQPEVVHTLVTPHISVVVETPITHTEPPEIYFGPDGEILPPGLIAIEEIPQEDTPLSPTLFGEDLPQSFPTAIIDFASFQSTINTEGYTLGQITMSEPTSSVGPSVPITSVPTLETPSMFTTSPESNAYGGPTVPLGYKSLSGTFSGASSRPWYFPMSSSGIFF